MSPAASGTEVPPMMLQCPACLMQFTRPQERVEALRRGACPRCGRRVSFDANGRVIVVGIEDDERTDVDATGSVDGPDLAVGGRVQAMFGGRGRGQRHAQVQRTMPGDFPRWDFRDVGLIWRLRTHAGARTTFRTVAELDALVARAEIGPRDLVSHDDLEWTPVGSIDHRHAWFWQRWLEAQCGQIGPGAPPVARSHAGPVDELPLDDSFVDALEPTVTLPPPALSHALTAGLILVGLGLIGNATVFGMALALWASGQLG